MAKKENDKSSFNNPFSKLKGLSVSASDKPAMQPKARPEPEPKRPPQTDAAVDDEMLFAQAMGELGVRAEQQDDSLEKRSPQSTQKDPEPLAAAPEGAAGSGANVSRRQQRRIARNLGAPEATLDLHGTAAAEVGQKLEWFLENAQFHGCAVVRIVTGRGAHSAAGPVLRPLVEDYLCGPGRRLVATWVRAPKELGGEGALLAELVTPESGT